MFGTIFFSGADNSAPAAASRTKMPPRKRPQAAKVWSTWDNTGVIRDVLNDTLDLSSLRETEVAELCNFIAHGCTTSFGADLGHYCHAMSSNKDSYDTSTNRIIRRIVDSIREIWASEANQEKIFPGWFANRDVRDASFMSVAGSKKYEPSNVAVSYKIYNMVAEKLAENPEYLKTLSGKDETPRLVPLNVA